MTSHPSTSMGGGSQNVHSDPPNPNSSSPSLSFLPQPHASSSRIPTLGNPQLGSEPYFAYPTPTRDDLEEELPPVFEGENVPMGQMLDRVVRRGYGELRELVDTTLPSLSDRQKPQPIIHYARTTRQSILKYLAVLRWKSQVDVPIYSTLTSSPQVNGHATASYPTPHSGTDSTDSPGYVGKGKGRAIEGDSDERGMIRGRVTDARRIEVFMAHQNAQHAAAVEHLRHTSKVVDGLRMRNPDLLTAISTLSLGTYPRLPTSLTEAFLPKPALTNRRILTSLRRLNPHIRFRLRCIDYLPPELIILEIKDGRLYFKSKDGQWKAELTIINFGEGINTEVEGGRWWLTGVEWGWREKGVDDPGGRRLEGEERKAVLDLANMEILPKREVVRPEEKEVGKAVVARRAVKEDVSMAGSPAVSVRLDDKVERVDAPLVRIFNFLQHLCLTYQLEVLYTQAMVLAGGKWRGQLSVDLDRTKKLLILKYWLRSRPPPPHGAQPPKRPNQAAVTSRTPMVGGTLTVSLVEDSTLEDDKDLVLAEVSGEGTTPSERLLRLRLGVKWEVGEVGEGGGWKNGDILDSSDLVLIPDQLSISDILESATSTHASHLTKHLCTPLIVLPRLSIFPADLPSFSPDAGSNRPLSLRVPLPSQYKSLNLLIGISTISGLVEIEDEGASPTYEGVNQAISGRGLEDRGKRAKMACASVNEGKTRLGDDIGRLITAIITENIEGQMRSLGYTPTRRLAIRSQDMAKSDLHPASTIFLPLPTSERHYLTTKITASGILFELLQLVRIPAENGVGMKLVIGERAVVDLGLIRGRRKKPERNADVTGVVTEVEGRSAFMLDNKDIRDLFIYSNALVAQSIIESQLKSRSIPFILKFPPTSGSGSVSSKSPIAGMIPTFVVNAADLLKDGKAADVAMPKVFMQIKGWWLGDKCSAVTVVQLRHRPSAVTPSTSNSGRTAKSEGITFDQASSVVHFQSDDLGRCVPGFLEQWERLSKVIIVAGTVNKLNQTPQFKDVSMISFDLRTATLAYSPGYLCSITYDSTADAYVVSFDISRPGRENGGDSEIVNPHDALAGLLSWELNELVQKGKDVASRFIGLLRATLPFLLEINSSRPISSPPFTNGSSSPQLVVLGIRQYRLVWDIQSSRRYAIDFILLPDPKWWIIKDAYGTDESCGELQKIRFDVVSSKVWDGLRQDVTGSGKEGVQGIKLDDGEGLMIAAEAVAEGTRLVMKEVGELLGGKK